MGRIDQALIKKLEYDLAQAREEIARLKVRMESAESVCCIVQQSKYAPGSALDIAIQKWLIQCGELKLAECEKVPGKAEGGSET